MAAKLANNAVSTLASSITSGATSLAVQSADAALFPGLGAGEWFPIVVVDVANNREVMKVTAVSGATFTVTRAQEGTTAKAFSAGAKVELRATAAVFTEAAAALAGKSNVGHRHPASDIDDLPDVETLQAEIDGKAPLVHTHDIDDVTGLDDALDAKLPLAGGVMTGNLEIRRASALIQLAQADGSLPWTMKYEPSALAFYYNGITKNQFKNDGDFYSAAAGGWLASLLAGKAAASHTHTMSQITDLSIVPPAPPAIGSQIVSAGGFGYGAIVAGSQLNVGGTSLPGTWRADGAVIEAAIYSHSTENGPSWPTVRYCFCTRIS